MQIFNLMESVTGLSSPVQSRLLSSIIIILIIWLARTVAVRIIWHRTAPYGEPNDPL
jgi:hypothetical protein